MIEPSCEVEGHDKALRPRQASRSVVLPLLLSITALTANAAGQSDAPALHDAPALQEEPIAESDRDHWAFKPLVRVPPPEVKNAAWAGNPVDRFLAARLEQAGLSPMPPADRATLLRRATLDLTGLPPTPEDLDAFVADASTDAWGKVLDRLLASPAYGERWAQHWLDLARFAESDGFEFDKVRPDAWRYRDWVIEALNADMPYDEFIRLQLAGDELRPGDAPAAVATGFLLAGPDMPDLNLQEERRHNLLNEMTATVGAVFLGLQVGCAQCHDHKYDPVSQADFYRLRAVFEGAELFKPHALGRVMHEPSGQAGPGHLMVRGDFRRPGPELEPGFPRIANPWNDAVAAPAADAPSTGRRTALARWLSRPDHPLVLRVIVNRVWQQHFGRGLVSTASDFGVMGSWPASPELLDWLATELPSEGWSLKRLHRLLLASAAYRQASRPASSDWSAEETAAAKQSWQRSIAADPPNELYARANRRRLEGEAIRDAMLAASDSLSLRRGGPGVMPPLPEELIATLLKGQWSPSEDEEDCRRRSIYLMAKRNLRYPLFEAFDRPDALSSCARRDRSTTAPQALVLLNSEFSLEQSRRLAGYLLSHSGNDVASQIALAYRRVLSRSPTAEEAAAARELLIGEADRLREEGRSAEELALPQPLAAGIDIHRAAALVEFCLALFNTNEFVYVD
jgi:hypothetical protein